MKLYLDNNVVSAIVRKDHELEVPALGELVRRAEAGEWSLVTSMVTSQEIDRCTGPHAPAIRNLYESMKKIPYVEHEVHVGFDSFWDDELGGWSNPLYDVDASWQSLRDIGLDSTDSHHIMLALKDGCDVFVTCDRRSILNRRNAIEARHPITLLRPSEFIARHQPP